jgi:cobalt/nickel transport system permease protein
MIVVTVSLRSVRTAALGLLLSYGLMAAGSLPARLIVRRLGAVHLFLLPCFAILPFTFGGESVALGPLQVSEAGLRTAATLYFRAVAAVTLSLALVYSTPMFVLLQALQRLRTPRVLVLTALLTYRYTFTLWWEVSRVRGALATRGYRNRAALSSYRTLANVLGLTFLRSLERTERIQRAMQCRGYQGEMRSLHSFAAGRSDYVKTLGAALAALGLLALDHTQQTPLAYRSNAAADRRPNALPSVLKPHHSIVASWPQAARSARQLNEWCAK